jgi:hypothetical protein
MDSGAIGLSVVFGGFIKGQCLEIVYKRIPFGDTVGSKLMQGQHCSNLKLLFKNTSNDTQIIIELQLNAAYYEVKGNETLTKTVKKRTFQHKILFCLYMSFIYVYLLLICFSLSFIWVCLSLIGFCLSCNKIKVIMADR